MRIVGLLPLLPLLLACRLCAWSPSFHESQTLLAARLTPQGMAGFLQAHRDELLQGARGQANDQVPTVEEVEAQFKLIIGLSDGSVRPGRVVRELGVLAHQVELLTDPSAVRGTTALRDSFEAYADEKLPHLVLSREPFWAVHAAIDSRPVLLRWAKVKYERHEVLLGCFDETNGRRVGPWDDLSVPYAQLQLAYSNGVNATANLWILLWRAVGGTWVGAGTQ